MLQFAAITMEMEDWSFFIFLGGKGRVVGWSGFFPFFFPLPFGSVRRWTLDGWSGGGGSKKEKRGGGKKRLEFPVKNKRWKRLLHCDVNLKKPFFVFFFSGKNVVSPDFSARNNGKAQ